MPVLRHDIRKEFYAPVREHSRKPDQVADWLVDLYGDVQRLEMFARTQRPGWECFGNETNKFERI
jgi:N6-adenosine-specific RNA methylase IME4